MLTQIIGFTETGLLTNPFLDYIHPEHMEMVKNDYVKLLSRGPATPGFNLIRTLVEGQLGGNMEINRSDGTEYVIRFRTNAEPVSPN